MSEWISAKERMPEKNGRYLVVEDHTYIWVGVSCMRNGKFDMPIKYWMELPLAPKEYSLLESIHESAKDLYKSGLIDNETMDSLDKLCLSKKNQKPIHGN